MSIALYVYGTFATIDLHLSYNVLKKTIYDLYWDHFTSKYKCVNLCSRSRVICALSVHPNSLQILSLYYVFTLAASHVNAVRLCYAYNLTLH